MKGNDEMSIESITSQVRNAEQYVIRSSESEKSQSELQTSQHVQQVQTDEYDKANPVGKSAEGIYSVSHDDEGKLKVNYTQPAEKSSKSESKTESKTEASKEQGRAGGASPSAGTTESAESENEEEIERLKKQRDALKAQLNRETNEEVKQALRVQLQNIEAQIAMKSTGVN